MVQCIIFIISDFFKPLSLKYSIDFENSWTELVGYTCEPVQDCFYCKRSPMDTCFAGCSIDNQHFGNFSFFWRLLIFQKSFKTIYRQYDYFSTNFWSERMRVIWWYIHLLFTLHAVLLPPSSSYRKIVSTNNRCF